MKRWKLKLENGVALGYAIRHDNKEETLNRLKDCFQEIHDKLPDVYDEDDLENDLEEIENQKDNLINYRDYDMTIEDVEEEINYVLDCFYDYCDEVGIWANLD